MYDDSYNFNKLVSMPIKIISFDFIWYIKKIQLVNYFYYNLWFTVYHVYIIILISLKYIFNDAYTKLIKLKNII